MAGLGDGFIFLSHVCIFGWTSLLFITWKARLHQVLNFWMSSEFIWRVSPKIYILGPVLPGSIWECRPGCWRATALHEESSQRQLWPRVRSFGASEARRSLVFKEGTAITGYTMDQSVWVWVDLLRCGFRVGKKTWKPDIGTELGESFSLFSQSLHPGEWYHVLCACEPVTVPYANKG